MKFHSVAVSAVVGVLLCGIAHAQDRSPEIKPQLSAARLAEIAAQRKALAKDASGKTALGDYFRVVGVYSPGGEINWTLQTSVRVLRLDKSKSIVTLVATHHFGTPGYWRSLSDVLARSQVVLFEGIMGSKSSAQTKREREAGAGEGTSAVPVVDVTVRYVRALSRIGGFVEEMVWEIDAWREGWVNADLSWNEFEAGLKGKPAIEGLAPLAKYVGELEELKRDLLSEASREQIVQGYVSAVLQQLPFLRRSRSDAWRKVAAARERIVLLKLTDVVRKSGDKPASVAIRYGAAHLPNIESAIRASGKVTLISHVWVDVLSVRQEGPRQTTEVGGSADDSGR
jgi:hypothetical protein